jgi:molybdenum cofactor biosynthesis enzyme MoaA
LWRRRPRRAPKETAIKPEHIQAYDRSRNLESKAVRAMCYAAHTNLFFEMQGRVMACCWNWRHPIGDARTQTLDEMWTGAQAALLRRALENYDFRLGCTFCDKQTEDGWTAGSVMRGFDQFAVGAPDPQWPQRMEFSISNSCNLECIMCSGVFSSSIRANREKLPPTRTVYSRAFIESLRKYLPHLSVAKFLGGEPFLITEYYRIWEMLVECAPHVRCHVTTNGTIFNPRVAKFMEKLSFSFAVSLDGATRETVESIRVNADFDMQMTNLRRLRDYTRERNTDLSLTFCFMRQNWHEFGEFCLLADEWGCNVGINTVNNPPQFSVYNLPIEELRKIADTMQKQAVELDSRLKRNRGAWFGEFERLRRKCA